MIKVYVSCSKDCMRDDARNLDNYGLDFKKVKNHYKYQHKKVAVTETKDLFRFVAWLTAKTKKETVIRKIDGISGAVWLEIYDDYIEG